ncbi:GMP synthase [glutamine-hydrolyzing]-like [Gossypium australe]|uniref:GMP synthase [glutamine-hydrolyzing]-like n=1 Tax=Gossypium australe TaxID=47621 RepID=A0A5B6UK41_9ROSI|nr:GMP synthase [glutamine-hydrolyzing]-like [Gossypium australe]
MGGSPCLGQGREPSSKDRAEKEFGAWGEVAEGEIYNTAPDYSFALSPTPATLLNGSPPCPNQVEFAYVLRTKELIFFIPLKSKTVEFHFLFLMKFWNSRYCFENSFLKEVSQKICNNVRGVNRVTLDITSKPPSTIEWE